MLKLITSNRFERLTAKLIEALSADVLAPFTPQPVIISSTAIKRSVELRLADERGICANIQFDFLGQWLWHQFGKVIDLEKESPFSINRLTWRIFLLFGEPRFTLAHPRLDRYLSRADPLMRFEFSKRCAGLFDQYLSYRSDWLEAWLKHRQAADADESWQAALWRHIASDLGAHTQHPSVLFFQTLKDKGQALIDELELGPCLRVFCLPSMPRLYLDMLKQLATWIDVEIYAVNPCAEYWYDIVNPKRLSRLQLQSKAQYHELGNRLLASWGQQRRDYLSALIDHEQEMVEESDFEIPQASPLPDAVSPSLLATLQHAILKMEDPDPGSHRLAPDDRSLEIHVCHSLARELEVLRDQLLSMFAAKQAPKTSEVLVLTPDLEAAAPLIESIFGSCEGAAVIPYVISGRPIRAINDYAQSLLAILRFARSRFEADQLFSLLQRPLIARRFGINDEDLTRIQSWLDEAGIRWAIDGKHRQRLGLPDTDAYSLSNGLERLYLGYAMPAHHRKPIQGLLPAGDPEGLAAQTLGRLQTFVDALSGLHDRLTEAMHPESWLKLCLQALEQFTDVAFSNQDDYRTAVASINALYQALCDASVESALDAEVFLAALESCFDEPLQGAVPAGCLCFASMHSMRALPYRIICLVGLGDEAFPSRIGPLEFDLMAQRPRAGDRQKRLEDRALFLDLLLAARDRLYISYTGRSILDNSQLPPSMLLAELIDSASLLCAELPGSSATSRASDAGSVPSGEAIEAAKRRLIIEHPLQPFSVDYFRQDADPRMRSYRGGYREAQAHRLEKASANRSALRFFASALTAPSEQWRSLRLENLIEFFSNPSRYLLKNRLGLVLKRVPGALENHEPFELDHRSRQKFADRLIDFALAGESADCLRSYAQAGLEFPPGQLGAIARDRELASIIHFAAQLKPRLSEPQLEALTHTVRLELDGEHYALSHSISGLRLDGLCRYRYADANCYDYLRAWLEHLALQTLALPSAILRCSSWHFRDRVIELGPIDEAQSLLTALLKLYREGLTSPIRFFPKSAWAYVTNGQSLHAARQTWHSSVHRPYGEADDPAHQIALRGLEDPLDSHFEQHAQAVFGPLLEALGEIKP